MYIYIYTRVYEYAVDARLPDVPEQCHTRSHNVLLRALRMQRHVSGLQEDLDDIGNVVMNIGEMGKQV